MKPTVRIPPSIKLKTREHELVKEIARVEGRTMAGLMGIALRMYATKRQPELMKRVLGEPA